ncbi:MAG: phage holin family protein [Chloroflexi bacterium]|nr:phage holin family protein [Chloroflexota bacterium]MBI1854431.1 phage holin family protein [Chloroflexota bacterium]MBI3338936.1 phage holin family protein [Chloroflexota bacterium]
MTKFILRWVINAIAILLAVIFVPGISLGSGLVSVIWLALIFGLVNAFVRPLLKLLTCPLIILTLGLFTLLINTFLFWLMGQIGQFVGIRIVINGFWPAFFGGLVVSVVSVLLTLILKDELKGRNRSS